MMEMEVTTIKDGGPAFPQHDLSNYGIGPQISGYDPSDEYSGKYEVAGMSLRDWFAGQALKAIVGAVFVADIGEEDDECADALSAHDIARTAYDVASAMLAVREAN